MSQIANTAKLFFEACEAGLGWEECKAYCAADASFAAQAGTLEGIDTLQGYCDWMKGLLGILPDGRYELQGFAADSERNCVLAYAVFHGTHTGEGGPVPPTGRAVESDYVYQIVFDEGGRIAHMVKIWNDGAALAQLGWA